MTEYAPADSQFVYVEDAAAAFQLGRLSKAYGDSLGDRTFFRYPRADSWHKQQPDSRIFDQVKRLLASSTDVGPLYLSGRQGSGKTHLVLCTGYWWMERDDPPRIQGITERLSSAVRRQGTKAVRVALYLPSPLLLGRPSLERQILEVSEVGEALWIVDDAHQDVFATLEFVSKLRDIAGTRATALLAGWPAVSIEGRAEIVEIGVTPASIRSVLNSHDIQLPSVEVLGNLISGGVSLRDVVVVGLLDSDELSNPEATTTYRARRLTAHLTGGEQRLLRIFARLRVIGVGDTFGMMWRDLARGDEKIPFAALQDGVLQQLDNDAAAGVIKLEFHELEAETLPAREE